jgi:hypothetical protein
MVLKQASVVFNFITFIHFLIVNVIGIIETVSFLAIVLKWRFERAQTNILAILKENWIDKAEEGWHSTKFLRNSYNQS